MVRWRQQANEFATSHLERQTEEPAMWRNVVPCDEPAGQGNDFELIPTVTMESWHSVDGPTDREFSSIYIIRELWPSEVGSRSRRYQKHAFWKNDPLREDIENFVPKRFTISQIHVLCANFVKFGRPEIGKVVHCLPGKKKTKIHLALASAQIAPKICQGQRQTIYSEFPKFHPNRFTSGWVIAECVNTVETCDKVFPLFGGSLASSRIINKRFLSAKNANYIWDVHVVSWCHFPLILIQWAQ